MVVLLLEDVNVVLIMSSLECLTTEVYTVSSILHATEHLQVISKQVNSNTYICHENINGKDLKLIIVEIRK